MDRKITSRLNMANAVKEVCDDNVSVVALVPAMVALVVLLKNRITVLKDIIKRISLKKKGLRKDKDEWEEKLTLLLSIVCGSGVSYGKKINDVVMEENFSLAQSTLEGLRDTELIEKANAIIEMQSDVAAQLIEYGITTAFMDDVKLALEKFEEKNSKPIVNIYTTEADNAEAMTKAFELSDFVLQDMMKAALIYKVLNLNFYNSLKNATRVSDVGVRHKLTPEEKAARKAERKKKREEAAKLKLLKQQQSSESEEQSSKIQHATTTPLEDAMKELKVPASTNETPQDPTPSTNGVA